MASQGRPNDRNTLIAKYQRPNQTPSPIWLTTCHIPITIEGRQHKALSDSQSSCNLISRDFADHHDLVAKETFQAFRMIDGTTQISTGFTWIRCGVKNHSAPVQPRLFYIFETLNVPLLIGRSFWEDSLSRDHIATVHVHYTIRYPFVPLAFYESRGSGELLMATVDTGTSANLISLLFVRKNQFSIKARPFRQIRTANGRVVSVAGTIKTKIQIGSLKGAFLDCTFLVIASLPYDVGLGRSFLFKRKNKLLVSSNLTYITQTSEFVLYGANNEMSSLGKTAVDPICSSIDPGDDKGLKRMEKDLANANKELEEIRRSGPSRSFLRRDNVNREKKLEEKIRKLDLLISQKSKDLNVGMLGLAVLCLVLNCSRSIR